MRKSKLSFCCCGVFSALAVALFVTLFAIAAPALAQDWPSKPIKAFIPFGAGSATDIIPRAVFDQLSPALGQPSWSRIAAARAARSGSAR